MSALQYWKNQLPSFLLQTVCMTALSVFLLISGNTLDTLALILLVWALLFTAVNVFRFQSRRRYLDRLLSLTENLEERYLIAELMEKPERADDQVFYRILKLCDKSMLEKIGLVRQERTEYREYIEQWIHEVKTPITAVRLLCENNRAPFTRDVLRELEQINRYTEQALYYARSEHTERDYSVREIRLFDAVHQAIADNKQLLLRNDVKIELEETELTVYSDEKWICFILNQLIVNAVKYRTGQPILRFFARREQNRTILLLQDNGIGIPAGDLPRIFEKGFTGVNGRKAHGSTGIGLYLCKRLCDKLGIEISADSGESGTVMRLTFFCDYFHHPAQVR